MSTHGGPARSSRENWKIGCKVYVGNLSEGASKADIEDAFQKYGPLKNCWVARNPPGFAFVEFEDSRDAEDACRSLDGTRIAGGRIKAEMSHGRTRRGRGGGMPPMGRGPPPYPYGGIGRGGYAGGPRGGHYNGHGDPYGGGPRGGGPYGGGHHGGGGSGSYIDRSGRDRYPPPPSSRSMGGKDYRHHTRSRSNSLGKSPPPSASALRATARPRTPPSRTSSPERGH